MSIDNIKKIFIHQIKVFKLKLLLSVPAFIIIIIVFIIPSIVNHQNIHLDNYSELLNLYRQQNPLYDNNNLIIIMLADIKLLNYLLVLTFINPLFLTIDLIVKEKEEKTIENLFLLPLTDFEILLGKVIASLITTILLIYFIYALTLIVTFYFNYKFLFYHFISAKWLFSIFVLIPVISYFINIIAITISCNVSKYQTAQFIAIIVLLPFMIFFVLISNGTIIFYNIHLVYFFIIILFLNIILTKFSIGMFNREKILIKF